MAAAKNATGSVMVGHLFQNYDTIYVRFFPTYSCNHSRYGRPFVSKLWHDICAVFSHVYLQSFLLHDIRAFFCHVYLRFFLLCGVFIPKYMTIFVQTRIYMHKKANRYTLQTSMWYMGFTESRRIRGTESYRQLKTPSCTMELKSNFSLFKSSMAAIRARFGSYSLPSQ